MQRTENGMIVISCDFTGIDWDEHLPMIEGHRGSVLSLEALALAVEQMTEAAEPFECTMCRRKYERGEKCWLHANPPQPETANPNAVICFDCIQQADRAFDRDPDTKWTRQLPSTDRWR
jgi:hypothetical protein